MQEHFMAQRQFVKNKGYVILLSVLIISAAGLAVSIALISMGIGSTKTTIALQNSNNAKAYANACLESALMQIRNDDEFEGKSTITFEKGDCSYQVNALSDEEKELFIIGASNNITRKVKAKIDTVYPKINLSYYQEVADF